MLGNVEAPYAEVPWFWSDQYDANLQLVGLPGEWDSIATRTSAAGSFLVCYFKAGRMEGAVAMNSGRDLKLVRRLMQAKVPVDPDRISDLRFDCRRFCRGNARNYAPALFYAPCRAAPSELKRAFCSSLSAL